MTQRIGWVDVAKGIGIIFVVLGHNNLPFSFIKYIYSFHMPLFFFLSGFLFNGGKYQTFFPYFRKKFYSLIVPYFCYFFIVYFYWILIGRNFGTTTSNYPIYKPLIDVIYSAGHLSVIFGTLWFLTGLFVTALLFYWVNKNIQKELIPILLIGLSVLGFLSQKLSFRLPWSIDAALIAVGFYGVGFLLKEKLSDFLAFSTRYKWLLATAILVAIVVDYLLANRTQVVSMQGNGYGNYFIFYGAAFLGIFSWAFTAKILEKNRVLTFLGKNSLTIFGLHQITAGVSRTLFGPLFHKLGLADSITFTGVFCTITAICLLIPIIYLITRYIPFINGGGGFKYTFLKWRRG